MIHDADTVLDDHLGHIALAVIFPDCSLFQHEWWNHSTPIDANAAPGLIHTHVEKPSGLRADVCSG